MKKNSSKRNIIGGIARKISEGFYVNIERPPMHNLNIEREDDDENDENDNGNRMPGEEAGIEKIINPDTEKWDNRWKHRSN